LKIVFAPKSENVLIYPFGHVIASPFILAFFLNESHLFFLAPSLIKKHRPAYIEQPFCQFFNIQIERISKCKNLAEIYRHHKDENPTEYARFSQSSGLIICKKALLRVKVK